ncbi:MAG: hypothetical protein AMS25_04090 [Gemmatimonas sp. SM23_52]|nr:MAG: hypothetical protein AMS25_04090 [Gemmatimonas sp. SM23_52]
MSQPRPNRPGLLAELKRRRVFRVAVVYAAVAFVIWLAAEIAFPALALPDWTLTLVVVLTLLGFPVAIVFAWAFDITPSGIRRSDELALDASGQAAHTTWLSLPTVLAVLAMLAIGIAAGWLLKPGPGEPGRAPAATGAAAASIAVLPFVNLREDPANEYSGDGLADELSSVLSRVPDLKVAARTSAFAFKGRSVNVSEIGEALNVATVLEGSVRKGSSRASASSRRPSQRWSRRTRRGIQNCLGSTQCQCSRTCDLIRASRAF